MKRWKAHRKAYLALNGGYYYRGYGEIVRRYLLTPKESPIHPGMPQAEATELPQAQAGLFGSKLAGAPQGPATQRVPAKPM